MGRKVGMEQGATRTTMQSRRETRNGPLSMGLIVRRTTSLTRVRLATMGDTGTRQGEVRHRQSQLGVTPHTYYSFPSTASFKRAKDNVTSAEDDATKGTLARLVTARTKAEGSPLVVKTARACSLEERRTSSF